MSSYYPGLTREEAALVNRVADLEGALSDAEAAVAGARTRATEDRRDHDFAGARHYEAEAIYWTEVAEGIEGRLESARRELRAAGISEADLVEPDRGPDHPIGSDR